MSEYSFSSGMSGEMVNYLEYKEAAGFKKTSFIKRLQQFDRFCAERGVNTVSFTEEDAAASTDYIADAMSGVDTIEKKADVKSGQPSEDIAKLKLYTLLLGVVIVLEIAGIAILAIL